MFSSKRKVGRTNKQMTISLPFQNPTQKQHGPKISSSLPKTEIVNGVVLKAKYDFVAKKSTEMSVHKEEYLKLLKRHGNGWLSVQSIENTMTGLVPSSYMEIAVNDSRNPITIEWLTENSASREKLVHYIASAKVTHALLNTKSKVWYKLDAVLTSGKEVSCSKYHRDFQNLLSALQKEINIPIISKLTESPPTINFINGSEIPKKITQEYSLIISNLNLLLQSLLKRPDHFTKSLLAQFIMDQRPENLVFKSKVNVLPEEKIINSLEPHSTLLLSAGYKSHSFSTTAPLEPISTATSDKLPTRSSPMMKSTPVYSRSNVLYLSYLNQSSDHATPLPRKTPPSKKQPLEDQSPSRIKSQPRHSGSIRTLDSINSLIQMFELSLSDDDDDNEEDSIASPIKNYSFASTNKSNSSTSSLMGNDFRPCSNATRASSGTSDFPNPLKSVCSGSSEPVTPKLGQTNLFGSFMVEDCFTTSPLQNKLHEDCILPMRKKTDEKDLVWSNASGLDTHVT